MARSFKEMSEKDEHAVLIVDFLNLAFRWKHQGTSDFRESIIMTVESFANSFKCGKIIITADNRGSSYRKGIDPNYKGNRKDLQDKQTDAEKEAFEKFIAEYVAAQELVKEKYPLLVFEGVEADDIAAHIVKNREFYGFSRIMLLSSDRDWDLLINKETSRFSYVTKKEVNYANWDEHYDIPMEQYISYKCLVGDAGDNVLGIPGVGPKRAVTLLEQYGTAFDVYDSIPLPGKYKYIQNVNEYGDRIPINYELMDLLTFCDDAIGQENLAEIKELLL